jgi:hypothetical protein
MIKFTLADEVTEFDGNVLMNDEAILLEKVTGRRLADLAQAFEEGEMEARVVYFWLARRRAYGPEQAGKLSDLRFNVADFRVEFIKPDTGTAPDPSTPATTDESVADTAEPPASPPSSKKPSATSAPRRSTAASSPGKSGSSPRTSGKR